jgi:hypothetical protein
VLIAHLPKLESNVQFAQLIALAGEDGKTRRGVGSVRSVARAEFSG